MASTHPTHPSQPTHLTPDQLARVEALKAAREILLTRPNLLSSTPADVVDLYHLTQYILTGDDPWPSTKVRSATISLLTDEPTETMKLLTGEPTDLDDLDDLDDPENLELTIEPTPNLD